MYFNQNHQTLRRNSLQPKWDESAKENPTLMMIICRLLLFIHMKLMANANGSERVSVFEPRSPPRKRSRTTHAHTHTIKESETSKVIDSIEIVIIQYFFHFTSLILFWFCVFLRARHSHSGTVFVTVGDRDIDRNKLYTRWSQCLLLLLDVPHTTCESCDGFCSSAPDSSSDLWQWEMTQPIYTLSIAVLRRCVFIISPMSSVELVAHELWRLSW